MDSRLRVRSFARGDEAFEAGHSFGEVGHLAAQLAQRRLRPVVVSPWRAWRAVADEHAAALAAGDQVRIAQDVDRVVDGHHRDAVVASELPAGRQSLTRLEGAVGDRCAQVVSDLQVRRSRVVGIGSHISSVDRPRSLGRPPRQCQQLVHVRLAVYCNKYRSSSI